MNIIGNYFWIQNSANIVKPCEVDLLHDICPELHEGLDITDIAINPGEADDDPNTEEDKMSDEQALTHTQSYQQLEPPPSRSCILQTCFQKV